MRSTAKSARSRGRAALDSQVVAQMERLRKLACQRRQVQITLKPGAAIGSRRNAPCRPHCSQRRCELELLDGPGLAVTVDLPSGPCRRDVQRIRAEDRADGDEIVHGCITLERDTSQLSPSCDRTAQLAARVDHRVRQRPRPLGCFERQLQVVFAARIDLGAAVHPYQVETSRLVGPASGEYPSGSVHSAFRD